MPEPDSEVLVCAVENVIMYLRVVIASGTTSDLNVGRVQTCIDHLEGALVEANFYEPAFGTSAEAVVVQK